MRFKDIIDKKIAINCRTEEELRKLFEYAKDNGLRDCQSISDIIHLWEDYQKNTCFRFSYSEFDNKENEDRYDPQQPSAEDEVKTEQMYGAEDQPSDTGEAQASTAEETEASAGSEEQSSVYHYSYERGEQAEPTGSTQNSQQ